MQHGEHEEEITTRELQVIEELVCGATAREVADRMNLSFHTIRSNRPISDAG